MPQKLIIILSAVIFCFGLLLLAVNNAPPDMANDLPVSNRKKITNFSFTSLDGAEHSLSDFQGKIVFINSWFSRCPPCVKEMPDFLELARRHPDDMVFIALSADKIKTDIDRYFSKLPKKVQLMTKAKNVFFVHDKGSYISRKFLDVKGFPQTTITDRDGHQLYKIKGVIDWLSPEVESIFSRQKSSHNHPLEQTPKNDK